MDPSTFFALGPGLTDKQQKASPEFGAMIGIVTDNVHPDGQYMVRVRFPVLPAMGGSQDQSWWCRISTIMASKNGVGAFFLPEIDDEVLVVFANGDFQYPIVVGCLWNGIDKPAYSNKAGSSETKRYQNNDEKFKAGTEAKKNDIRGISTRKGHEITLNDNASKPGVVISSGQKARIVLNDKDNQPTQIEIYDGKEENYILIDNKNKKITMETKTGDVLIKAKETVTIECKKLVTKSSETTDMTVGTNYTMTSKQNFTVKSSGGSGTVQSSSTLTIKGSTVNIN